MKWFNSLVVQFAFLLGILDLNPLYADHFDVYGSGSRASAMGNVGASIANDYHGTHYNPATLVLADRAVGTGMTFALKSLQVNLSPRPSGYDLPDLGPNSPAVPTSYRLRSRRNTDENDQNLGVFVGANTDLGTEQFRLSFLAFLPVYQNSSLSMTSFNQEKEQYFSNQLPFTLLGGRMEHFMLEIGFAYHFLPWLSIGVSNRMMPNAQTNNYVYMDDPSQQDRIDLNLGLNTSTVWQPQLGILIFPSQSPFRIGAGFREEHAFKIVGINEIQVRGLQNGEGYPVIQKMNILTNYSPRQIYWSGSWIKDEWLISSDLVYSIWSMYRNEHNEKANHYLDTLSTRFGIEYKYQENQKLRFGYAYHPSPVPNQTGRTNDVDNDRSMLSLGSGHQIEFKNTKLQLSWHFQFHYLHPRTTIKDASNIASSCTDEVQTLCDELPDQTINPSTGKPWPQAQGLQTGNPGFPGFASGGWLTQFGLELSWVF